jgi:hypothetical protein
MRERKQIEFENSKGEEVPLTYNLILEVLLDIRDLLKPEITGETYDK